MLDINIDYSSLSQAIGDLEALENELYGGTELKYRGKALMESSQGDTCSALNQLYTKMAEYQLELISLVGITREVMRSIGITFSNEESESAKESIQQAG